MKTQITLKQWSAYLPYQLKVQGKYDTWELFGLKGDGLHLKGSPYLADGSDLKPILRDLSDLTKEIEHEGEKVNVFFQLSNKLQMEIDVFDFPNYLNISVFDFDILLKYKFNVFSIPDELIVKVTENFNPYN